MQRLLVVFEGGLGKSELESIEKKLNTNMGCYLINVNKYSISCLVDTLSVAGGIANTLVGNGLVKTIQQELNGELVLVLSRKSSTAEKVFKDLNNDRFSNLF